MCDQEAREACSRPYHRPRASARQAAGGRVTGHLHLRPGGMSSRYIRAPRQSYSDPAVERAEVWVEQHASPCSAEWQVHVLPPSSQIVTRGLQSEPHQPSYSEESGGSPTHERFVDACPNLPTPPESPPAVSPADFDHDFGEQHDRDSCVRDVPSNVPSALNADSSEYSHRSAACRSKNHVAAFNTSGFPSSRLFDMESVPSYQPHTEPADSIHAAIRQQQRSMSWQHQQPLQRPLQPPPPPPQRPPPHRCDSHLHWHTHAQAPDHQGYRNARYRARSSNSMRLDPSPSGSCALPVSRVAEGSAELGSQYAIHLAGEPTRHVGRIAGPYPSHPVLQFGPAMQQRMRSLPLHHRPRSTHSSPHRLPAPPLNPEGSPTSSPLPPPSTPRAPGPPGVLLYPPTAPSLDGASCGGSPKRHAMHVKPQPRPPPMPPAVPRIPEADLIRFLAEVEKLFGRLGSSFDATPLSGTTDGPPETPSSAAAQEDTVSQSSSYEKRSAAEPKSPEKAGICEGCEAVNSSLRPVSPPGSPAVLGDVWAAFGECSTLGLEVPTLGSERGPSLAYFTPFLSAMQIFAVPEHFAEARERKPCCPSALGVHNVDSDLTETPSPCPSDNGSDLLEDAAGGRRRHRSSGSISDSSVYDNGVGFLQSDACSTVQEEGFAPCMDVAALPLVTREPPALGKSPESGKNVLHLVANWAAQGHVWERPPLAQHADELICSHGDAGSRAVPSPAALRQLPLHSVHPSSWFAVLWHPLYRIPDADLQARFITYHSFGDGATACGNMRRSAAVRLAGCLMDVGDSTAMWTDHTVAAPDGKVVRWPCGMERELLELKDGADHLSRSAVYHFGPHGSVMADLLEHSDYKFVCSLRD